MNHLRSLQNKVEDIKTKILSSLAAKHPADATQQESMDIATDKMDEEKQEQEIASKLLSSSAVSKKFMVRLFFMLIYIMKAN